MQWRRKRYRARRLWCRTWRLQSGRLRPQRRRPRSQTGDFRFGGLSHVVLSKATYTAKFRQARAVQIIYGLACLRSNHNEGNFVHGSLAWGWNQVLRCIQQIFTTSLR